MRVPVLLFAAAAALAPAAAQDNHLQAGREMTKAFHEGRIADVWSRMTPTMRDALGSKEKLDAFHGSVSEQLGAEETVLSEEAEDRAGTAVYLRTSRFSSVDRPIVTQWSFTGDGKVSGFFIRPLQAAAESRFLDYETKADLRLAFRWRMVRLVGRARD